jgi:hypothetical protein
VPARHSTAGEGGGVSARHSTATVNWNEYNVIWHEYNVKQHDYKLKWHYNIILY